MTAQQYLDATLQKLSEPEAMIAIGTSPLEDSILAKLMSKKFRKLKADDAAVEVTKNAIHLSVIDNKPIAINVIFGGNKLWHFDEAPEIDWAELFTVLYLADWMKSIASVYQPGVYLEFYSEDVVLETMNNLPRSETDRYSETYIAMLAWLKQYLPENISFGYKRYGDEYEDMSEFLAELEEAKTKVFKELGNKLPVLNDHQKAATETNVRLRPDQVDDPLWREKAELIHKSIERTRTMERYINDPAWVPACPTYFPGCVTTGSTKRSLAKFWVAVGALERIDDSFANVVLTPKQLAAAQFEWEAVHLRGLQGKNFSKVRVLR